MRHVLAANLPPIQPLKTLSAVDISAWLLTFTLSVLLIYYGSDVLVPLALAGILSFVLAPAVRVLKGVGLPKMPSVLLVVVFALSLIAGAAVIVGQQAADLVSALPSYENTLLTKVKDLRSASVSSSALERARSTLDDLQRELDGTQPAPAQVTITPSGGVQGGQRSAPIPVEVHQPQPPPLETTLSFIKPLVSPIATTSLTILFLFFILLQREDIRDRFLRLVGTRDLQRTTIAMDDAGTRLSKFFIVQSALNTAFGFFIGTALWLLGIPNPIVWGALAGLMRFVPYIGSVISAVFPIILAAAIDSGWTLAITTAILFLVSEVVTGQLIEPMLYGRNTGLSPVAIVCATLFWTLVWGPIGLLLATPVTVCLAVIGRHVERLNFLKVLFGDEPALNPDERLYQRMLAGDPIEAIEVAEESLEDMPLATYYDEVAIKALRMAYEDALSGQLSRDKMNEIVETIEDVVEGLEEHAETKTAKATKAASKQSGKAPAATEPAELRATNDKPSTIISIPGRNVLDTGALLMLAQLLKSEGMASSIVPRADVAKLRAIRLPAESAGIVVLSHFAPQTPPTYARVLINRLRAMMPGAIIVVGFWSIAGEDAKAEEWRLRVGADRVATRISQVAGICRELKAQGATASAMPAAMPAKKVS